MTTYTLRQEPAPSNEVDDLISSLDAEFGKAAPKQRSAPRAKPAVAAEPVYVQMWFPKRVVMHATQTRCECCDNVWESIDGTFLEDQHRNGALRQVRVMFDCIPDEYLEAESATIWAEGTVLSCPICMQDQLRLKRDAFRARQDAALHELIRTIPFDAEDNQAAKESSDAAQ